MCGCMLMHAAMDHSGHQAADHPMPGHRASVLPAPSGAQCVHCSFALQPDFAFCPNCGMSVKTADCPACGRKVEPAWGACAYCGSPLGEARPVTA
jgi:RNA polymerase subunit RPABC4/transcription elongation factor Spt4